MALIHRSPLPDVDIPDSTLTAYVLRRADELADQPALIDGPSGRTTTFAELRDQISRFAGGLAAHGFAPGDTLALMAPNLPEYAVVFHGCSDCWWHGHDRQPHLYGRGGPLPAARRGRLRARHGAAVLVDCPASSGGNPGLHDGAHRRCRRCRRRDLAERALRRADRPGACRRCHARDRASLLVGHDRPSEGRDADPPEPGGEHRPSASTCSATTRARPHSLRCRSSTSTACRVLMNLLVANGVTVVTMPRFDLAEALDLVQRHRITRFFAVPPIVLALREVADGSTTTTCRRFARCSPARRPSARTSPEKQPIGSAAKSSRDTG